MCIVYKKSSDPAARDAKQAVQIKQRQITNKHIMIIILIMMIIMILIVRTIILMLLEICLVVIFRLQLIILYSKITIQRQT